MSIIVDLMELGEYEKAELAISEALTAKADSTLPLLAREVCPDLSKPVSAESLQRLWEYSQPIMAQISLLPPTERFSQSMELVRILSLPRAGLFRKCNERQKLEYAYLQKDVCFEKKEFVIDEFQRILLEAEREYSVVLRMYYGLAEFLASLSPFDEADTEFFKLAMKEICTAVEVQECTGRMEEFPQMRLARAACLLPLGEGLEDEAEKRRQLLSRTLTGKEALEAWDEFKPFAEPALRKKLIKQTRRMELIDKLQFWKQERDCRKN